MTIRRYFLGCPSWGLKDWVGHLYKEKKPGTFLSQYSSVFNTVEGNTTFYSLPPTHTVERWREATPTDFRFSFKLPKTITHERGLRNAATETNTFLRRMAPLGERLGPFMIQLPPSFGPDRLGLLERFLGSLPSEFQFAVEVRHPAFYDDENLHRHVDELLAHHACERVLMDTRSLRSGDADHPEVQAARHKKPDLAITPVALGPHPMVRFIGHPEADVNTPWLDLWADLLKHWIGQGRRPYFFAHCPNDFHAPELARRLHRRLEQSLNLSPMPEWPGESSEGGQQLSLFG